MGALRAALQLADVELERVLSAEPSASLSTRIRRAASADDALTPRERPWGWWAFAAAALILLVIGASWRLGPARPTPGDSVATRNLASPVAPIPANPVAEAVAPSGSKGISTHGRPGRSRPRGASWQRVAERARDARLSPGGPEVLVPPEDEASLLRLVVLMEHEHVAPPSLATAGAPGDHAPEVAPIRIEPLEIVPLEPAKSPGT